MRKKAFGILTGFKPKPIHSGINQGGESGPTAIAQVESFMAGFRADMTIGKPRGRAILKWLGIATLWLATLGAVTFGLLWNTLFAQMPDLPDTESLWAMNREPAIEFRAPDGGVIGVRGPRYGQLVSPADLPAHVTQAVLAVEDRRFYEHDGFDRMAMIRALLANVRAGETVQGASTLTQQLVKNLFLSPEKTLKRKAQEIRLAYELEKRLTKEEILELYINRIFLGARTFGLDAASHRYFGKPPQDLSIAEAALLAGLPQAPSRYSPLADLDAAITRRDFVIQRMVAAGYITPGMAAKAEAEPVALIEAPSEPQMGYVLDYATEQARDLILEDAPDLVVTLTVDPVFQAAAHKRLIAVLDAEGESRRASQAALVVMDHSGAIRALVGGRDYETSQFNRATQARRQPGSAFKAFVYAASIEAGLHPYDVRRDDPIRIGDWTPKNYGGRHVGPVTLSEAFATSLNTVAAELGQEVSIEKVIEVAHRFGVRSPLTPYPSVALGSDETTLFELTQAYGVFATGGKRIAPWLVAEVRTSRGDILYSHETRDQTQVYPNQHNRAMVGMMARVVQRGTGKAARLEVAPPTPDAASTQTATPISNVPRKKIWRDVAGKTGTSQDWRDALFVGFTGDFIGGVWVGNDDDTPMRRVTGGEMPAVIWHDVMEIAHADLPNATLPGAEAANTMTTDTERKLAYYRSLADAFAVIEAREVKLGGNDTLR